MKDYSKIATDNFRQGYNCAQSVLLAFAEEVNLDKETALKLSSSFGGGMGRLREVCGALSSMFMIAGFLKGYTDFDNDDLKAKHYELIQSLAEKFRAKFGTYICRELLELPEGKESPVPSKRTEEYYNSRPCEEFIKYSAHIIQENLLN